MKLSIVATTVSIGLAGAAFFLSSNASAESLPIEGLYQDNFVITGSPPDSECLGTIQVSQRYIEHVDENTFQYTFPDFPLPPTPCTRFHGDVFDCDLPKEETIKFPGFDLTINLRYPGSENVDMILDGQSTLRFPSQPGLFSCEGTDCETFGFSEQCIVHAVLYISPLE